MLKPTLFVDLDDTLFRSLRARESEGDHAVAHDVEGRPLSFMTPGERDFFDWLETRAEVIPVTARNLAAFRRISLAFHGPVICSFGGLVLESAHTRSEEWHARMLKGAATTQGVLEALYDRAKSTAHAQAVDMNVRIIGEEGIDLYLSVKHSGRDADRLAAFAAEVFSDIPPGWQIHLNRNNLAIKPPWLGKHHAVRFVMQHLRREQGITIGMGDSFSDLGFMGLCDFAMTPTGSQIFDWIADARGVAQKSGEAGDAGETGGAS